MHTLNQTNMWRCNGKELLTQTNQTSTLSKTDLSLKCLQASSFANANYAKLFGDNQSPIICSHKLSVYTIGKVAASNHFYKYCS